VAFYNTTELIDRTIRRLRQVGGAATQLYSSDTLRDLLEETYTMCREQRYWDHMMEWRVYDAIGNGQLAGVDLSYTVPADVKVVHYGNDNTPLPWLGSQNPARVVGNNVRYISATAYGSTMPFTYYPQSFTTVGSTYKLHAYIRKTYAGVFSNPDIVVPFDATALINGAAAKYAIDDGTNMGSVEMLQKVFNDRMDQLRAQHDQAILKLDDRSTGPYPTSWYTVP
jgi:hypothetical protein